MQNRNVINTSVCFVKKDDKYLMLRRALHKKISPNVWMAPGGKREHNEGLFEAARREVMEETGLQITNLKVLCTGCGYLKDLDQEIFFHIVSADFQAGELKSNTSHDGELRWLTLEEILKLDNLLAELKTVLPIVLGTNSRFISYKSVYESGNNLIDLQIESEQ